MSRIGKQFIAVPDGVQIQVSPNNQVQIKGSKGSLSAQFHPEIKIEQAEKEIKVMIPEQTKQMRALWGTTRALLMNMVIGTTTGFSKQLEIQGVGYKAKVEGKKAVFDLGFTNSCILEIPQGIEVKVEKNIVTVSGMDKQVVGEFAAQIRKLKPPEPYKGKGIRYVGEYVIRKEGKRSGGDEGK